MQNKTKDEHTNTNDHLQQQKSHKKENSSQSYKNHQHRHHHLNAAMSHIYTCLFLIYDRSHRPTNRTTDHMQPHTPTDIKEDRCAYHKQLSTLQNIQQQ